MADETTGTPAAAGTTPNATGDHGTQQGSPSTPAPAGGDAAQQSTTQPAGTEAQASLEGTGATSSPEGGKVGDQQAGSEWLPEALRGNDALKGFKDPAELAEAHLKLLDAAKTPETPEGYTITIPEGLKTDPTFVARVKTWAKDAGLSQAQFEEFAGHYMADQAAGEKLIAEARQKDERALKLEWAGDYNANLEMAVKAAKTFVGEEFASAMKADPVLKIVKAFHRIASKIGDDSFTDGEGAPARTQTLDRSGMPRLKFPSMGDK
jgi:hypothetical protein